MNIELRHNSYKTPLSEEKIISTALENDKDELELAVSRTFFDSDYDDPDLAPESDVGNDYQSYFKEAFTELSKHLGKPLFQGNFDSPDFKQWKSSVCPTAHVDQLVVWGDHSKKLYLRISQLDKEGEIVVAFGAEGCECNINQDFDYMASLYSK
jgi:hypothetical protein